MHRLWRMRQRCNGGVSESWPVFNMGAKETFSAMGLKATFMNGNVSDVELSVRASELDRAGKRNEDSMTVQSFCKAAKYGSTVLILAGLLGAGSQASTPNDKKPVPDTSKPAPAKPTPPSGGNSGGGSAHAPNGGGQPNAGQGSGTHGNNGSDRGFHPNPGQGSGT